MVFSRDFSLGVRPQREVHSSLEFVPVVVVDDVAGVHQAFHVMVHVLCQVQELHRHERLGVVWLCPLPIVGVVLEVNAAHVLVGAGEVDSAAQEIVVLAGTADGDGAVGELRDDFW